MATLAEIANAWGCSPQYVQQCKKKGMPTDTLENANAWKMANSERSSKVVKIGNGSGGGMGSSVPPPNVPIDPSDLTRDDIFGCLARARQTEKVAYALLHEAQVRRDSARLPNLVKAHREALRSRMEAEIRIEALHVSRGSKIDDDIVRGTFSRYMTTIRNLMEGLGSSVCRRANPSDPELAKEAISDGVRQIIAVIDKTKGGLPTDDAKEFDTQAQTNNLAKDEQDLSQTGKDEPK
jgi:hypothetical protein